MAQVDWVAVDGPTPWTGIQDFWDTRYAVDFQTIGNMPPGSSTCSYCGVALSGHEWTDCPRRFPTITSFEPWLPDIEDFDMPLNIRTSNSAPGCAIVAFCVYLVLWLAFWGGVLYVALHFILKWW